MRILSQEEIEQQVNACCGTWVKRKNLRNKLIKDRLQMIDFLLDHVNHEIRRCKASTMSEKDLRPLYSFKSRIERMKAL